jgi:hypothetical protein
MASSVAPGWYLTPVAAIPQAFAQARPYVEAVLKRDPDGTTLETIHKDLASGRKQLWGAWSDGLRGVIITEVMGSHCGPILFIWGAAGRNARHWSGAPFETIKRWASDMGCSAIRMQTSRTGWLRVLKNWDEVAIIMECRDYGGK